MTHFHAYRLQLLCSSVSLKARSYTVRFTLHSSISVTSSWLRISCTLKSSQTRSKKISPKNKKDLGMACHISPLKKAKKQGEMPLPSLSHIPSLNSNGMGPRLGNGISPRFFASFEGWNVRGPSLNHLCFTEKIFCYVRPSSPRSPKN